MVVFTCSHCGDAVKKKQVEKHYQFSCRGNVPALTCVDCLKDFNGDEHAAHTSCVTEEERYSAKGFVAKPQSGKKKQEEWVNSIKTIIDSNPNADKQVKLLLEQIVNDAGVPRKKPKFLNYCANKFRNTFHKTTYESVWELMERKKEELTNRTVQNGDECESNAVVNVGVKDKKRKRVDSSKDSPSEVTEGNETCTNVISVDNSENSKKKKKKQKKEGPNTNVTINNEVHIDKNVAPKISKKDKNRKQLLLPENMQSNKCQSTIGNEQTDEAKQQEIENGSQEQDNGLVPLSKKEKKEKRKREKYEKQLLKIQSEAVSKSEENVQTDQDNDTEHSKKKKRTQENGSSLSHEQLSTVKEKSKAKKHQQLDEVARDQNNGVQKEDIDTVVLKPQKFNWEETVIKVLKSKTELPLKRLEKKVVSEYINSGAHIESMEKVCAKFNKKIMKMHSVVVKKDVAKLS